MIKVKTAYIKLIGILIFSVLSFYYLSSANNLGSNEAAAQLTKKASIINWNQFKTGEGQSPSQLLDDDTYLNFNQTSGVKIVENVRSKPSLYIKSNERIYPILLHTRASGIPHFISGEFSRLMSPGTGLMIFPWILGVLTLILALTMVNNKLSLPFFLVVLTSPAFLYFTNPFFPDDYASFFILILALFIFLNAKTKKEFYLLGFLFGISLYIKLASIIIFPLFLIISFERIWKNIKSIIIGFLPVAIFFIAITNFKDFFHLIGHEKTLIKNFQFNIDVFKYFALNQFLPGLTFSHILSLATEFPKLDVKNLVFVFIHAVITLVFLIKFVRTKNLLKLASFVLLFILGTCVVASGLNEDLMGYIGQGLTLFIIVTFFYLSMEKIKESKKLFITLVTLLVLVRTISFLSWNKEFQHYANDFKGCVWAYDCMVSDWKKNNTLEGKQLITLYYLDIGQIEYFSQETITPLHVNWKYSLIPDKNQFIDFLEHYPSSEYFILTSKELGIPTDLAKYLQVEEFEVESMLKLHGLKLTHVKSYNYPAISRDYTLLKITKF